MKKSVLLLSLLTVVCIVLLLGPTVGCAKKKSSSAYPGQPKKGSPELMMNEAIFHLKAGNLDLAEKKLLKALKKNPTLMPAVNALGIVYLNKREFQKALKYFKQVSRTQPDYYDVYNYIGVVYTELGDYDIAKENLLMAANADKYTTPENAFANLAMLEIKQKRYDSAMRYINKGLQKNDHFAPLSNLKGIVLEQRKKYKEAMLWYKQALTLLTEPDVTYLINLGRVYSKMGDKGKALDTLERALSKAFTPNIKEEIHKLINQMEKDGNIDQ